MTKALHTNFKQTSFAQLFAVLILACATAYYIDIVAYTQFGFILSWIIFIFLFMAFIVSYSKGMMVMLFLCSTIPYYSRQLSNIYEKNEQWSNIFFTLLTVKLLSITLIVWLFGWAAVTALLYFFLKNQRISKKLICFQIIVLSGFPILLIGILNQDQVFPRYILSDLQYPVLILLGTMAGWRFVKEIGREKIEKIVIKIFWFAFLICGIRAYIFLIKDHVTETFSINLSVNSLILIPVVFTCLAQKGFVENKLNLFLFILLTWVVILPLGRGIWLILFLNTLLLLMIFTFTININDISIKKYVVQRIVYIALFGLFVFSFVFILQPKIIYFIIYKLSFFGHLLNMTIEKSTPVRIYEFKNILAENYNLGILGLLFGKGAGGYFTYTHYSAPVQLGIAAYSENQLNQGVFFSPHTFINYWLLKGGITGLVWYLAGNIYAFVIILKRALISRLEKKYMPVWMVFFCPVFWWTGWWSPVIAFLFGCLFAVLVEDTSISTVKNDMVFAVSTNY